jgi:predicted ATPase
MATALTEQNSVGTDDRTKPPFLRRVRIQGYKSIALCDVRLQPLTVLVGRNGTGKSNFLDALAFLRDAMETSVAEATKRRGGWSSIACRTSEARRIDFEIEAAFRCGRPYRRVNGPSPSIPTPSHRTEIPDFSGVNFVARYSLQLVAGTASVPAIARESLEVYEEAKNPDPRLAFEFKVHDGIIEWEGTEPDPGQATPVPSFHQLFAAYRPDRPLLSVVGTQPLIDLGDGLRATGFYNFYPEAIRHLQRPNPGSLLERNGSNLASVIEGLEEIDPDSVQRVREYLSTITEEVRHFDVVHYGDYETVRFQMRFGPPGTPLGFDASGMSDGTLRALAALIAAFQIHLPTGPSVIGIEEPETSLHPAATRALVDALQEATGRTQVLLTTHSGDLLADRDLDPFHLLVVRMRNGETQIARVDAGSREIIRKELYTLADLQRMDQLELDEEDLKRQAEAKLMDGEG